MSKLNKDILYLIFEELQEDSKALFSCLMVSRIWCETAIPILWRNPWGYRDIDYSNKICLFIIIFRYLFDDIKELITNQRIKLSSGSNQTLLFDYFSYCKSIDIKVINSIISIGSCLDYNQFSMEQKFYTFFLKKCLELKYFDMKSIKHQIFLLPEAMIQFRSLCELRCDTSIKPTFFYELSQICQQIQRLIISNVDTNPNYGIVKLIEVQKNLKHFEWDDEFDDDYFVINDPYEKILLALEKKVETINCIKLFAQYVENYEHTLLQELLPKFNKLKILKIDGYLFFDDEKLEKLKMKIYRDLEVLNIESNKLDVISSIIENSGANLKKILFDPYNIEYESNDFNEESLNFIRKVHENCPLVEYLTIAFSPTKNHFIELEKLLKTCKKLKSLLIVILNNDDTYFLINGEEFLRILIRSAPYNLKEIRHCYKFKFSLENLKNFLEEWKGNHKLSLFTTRKRTSEFTNLVDKYKSIGVIEKFENLSYVDFIQYILRMCYGQH